jgi:signal peptidase I
MRRVGPVVGTLAAVLVGLALLVFFVGMRHYRIPSSAMEPTLHCARPNQGCEAKRMDRILVPRFNWLWSPGRGDIVVLHTPPAAMRACGSGGIFVKRIVGLPGETLSERGGGAVYVDGKKLREPYIDAARRREDPTRGTWHVPEGEYFLLGDNRGASCDSRRWGAVPRHDIIGRVVLVYWPPGRIGAP